MALSGVGTVFKIGDGASNEQFSAIAEINNISGPNISRDLLETTSLDTTGGYKTFIGGFRDGGSIDLDMNFTRDAYLDFKEHVESDVVHNYQIVLPDASNTTLDFAGFVVSLGMTIAAADKIAVRASIKISSEIFLTS